MKTAEVYLNQKNKRIDKIYEYLVPDNAKIGQRVNVEFGNGNRKLEGLILNIKDSSVYEGQLKEITNIIDDEPILDSKQIELCKFLADQSFSLFYETLSFFTSGNKTKRNKKGEFESFKAKKIEKFYLKNFQQVKGSNQKLVLESLQKGEQTYQELKKAIPKLTKQTLNRLIELDIIGSYEEDLIKSKEIESENSVKMTSEADKEFYLVSEDSEIAEILQNHLTNEDQLVVIFPSVSKAERFSKLLENKYKIQNHLYTGYLSPKEKHKFYHYVKDGSYRIIIGSSAALFLPFKSLKSIIVCNVGEDTYLQNLSNNFNVVEIAERLAEIWNADLLAVDTVISTLAQYKLDNGYWINKSKENDSFKDIKIENISYLKNKDSNFLISDYLYSTILKNIKNQEKTVLFLNRKGYFNNYYCTDCGSTLECPDCGSKLKSIKNGKEVVCRCCGYTDEFPKSCRVCGNRYFEKSQFGIEKIEEQLKEIFPSAKVDIFYHGHIPKNSDADIILGTKSLLYLPAFQEVATVAGLLLDLDFDFPDYLASENSFRLYTELFRKYPDAEIIIQSRSKEKSYFKALKGDTHDFIEELMRYRRSAQLPPFNDVYTITLFDNESKILNKESQALFEEIESLLQDSSNIVLPIFKVRGSDGKYMRRFLVKVTDKENFKDILNKIYENGIIENLTSKVSILKNPANLS